MKNESKWIVFVAVLASLLEIIDTSIVNVALPTMMGNLGATLDEISMVITGYAIANAIILPVSSWFSERLGRRQYYIGCIVLFTITSVACGLAPNLGSLIVFRILQGLVGGALLPTSQALIYEQFPKEKAGMAGAIFGMSVMIGPALGPVMGGYLTDNFGWRSIFNINLPLGILAIFLGLLVIKNPAHQSESKKNPEPLDSIGLTLLVLGIGCLQYVLERGESEDWFSSGYIVVNTIISIVSLPTFIWWEMRVKNPIINVRLFKDAIVQSGIMLMSLLGFFLYGIVFLLPVFLGRTYHYNATQIGKMFIPGSILTMAMMPIIGRIMQSGKNPKVLIVIGFLGLEVCLYSMSTFSPLSSRDEILTSLYLRGFALSFLFVPINSSILSQYTGRSLGQVAGLLNLFRQLGGSVGIALVATLLNVLGHQNFAKVSSLVNHFNFNAVQFFNLSNAGLSAKFSQDLGYATSSRAAMKVLEFKIQNQVFMLTYLQLVAIMMIILCVAIVPLYRLKLQNSAIKVVDAH